MKSPNGISGINPEKGKNKGIIITVIILILILLALYFVVSRAPEENPIEQTTEQAAPAP